MTCQDVERLSGAYADGELELEQALAVEAHVAQCESCAARLEAGRALSQAIRSAPYFTAPAGLASRIRSKASASSAPQRERGSHRISPWLAAAASLAVGVLGTALVFRWIPATETEADRTAQAVVASHVRSLMADHLTDVVSSDRHTVKPWFAGRVEFSPPVPDLAADGFPLAGGRLDLVDGRTAVALVYRRGGHIINVLIWPTVDANAAPRPSDDPRGYHLIHWTKDRLTWWVASDLAAADLDTFATKLAAENERLRRN